MDESILHQILSQLGSIDSRLDSMDNRLDSMDSRLDSMDSRLDSMDNRLDSMNSRLDMLETDMTAVKEDLAFTKETALRMEIEHGDQLRALFDGYASVQQTLAEHTEILDRLESKVDRLDTVVGVHDVKFKTIGK